MQDSLGKPIEHAVDGENNSIDFDVAYTIRGDLREMANQLRARHGNDMLLLPMSATSSGGGIFQHRGRTTATVVGLRYDAPHDPQTRFDSNPDLCVLRQDEIVIDRERQKVSAGAAVTLNQLTRALADAAFVIAVTGIDSIETDIDLRIWKVRTSAGGRTFETRLGSWPRKLRQVIRVGAEASRLHIHFRQVLQERSDVGGQLATQHLVHEIHRRRLVCLYPVGITQIQIGDL